MISPESWGGEHFSATIEIPIVWRWHLYSPKNGLEGRGEWLYSVMDGGRRCRAIDMLKEQGDFP